MKYLVDVCCLEKIISYCLNDFQLEHIHMSPPYQERIPFFVMIQTDKIVLRGFPLLTTPLPVYFD